MDRLIILASVVVLAASGVNCANSSQRANPANDIFSSPSILAPSASDGAAALVAAASHGGGKGKPGSGSGSPSLALVMSTDLNANGLPNWGDSVTFNVSTTATTEPHVDLTCSENGVVVYGATTGYFASYPWPWTQIMTLSSISWPGGAADCTATLYYFSGAKNAVVASMNFTAYQ